ncbi:MAG: hypothetical protein GXX85_08370 [Ignavibacteria bacterium]|nr:hypothetical protein [Ignavibacteria bacterium]
MRVLPFLFISLLIFVTCQNKPTEPKPDDDEFVFPPDTSAPGSRDYVWEIDSTFMKMPYRNQHRIWGDAPNNIWVAGTGADMLKAVMRFDGEKWIAMNEGTTIGIDVWSLWGFSENDVWVGGNDADMIHYINGEREQIKIPLLEDHKDLCISDIWGESPNEIWAAGAAVNIKTNQYDGIILKYDGVKWEYFGIPTSGIGFLEVSKSKNENELYFLSSKPEGEEYSDSSGVFILNNYLTHKIYGSGTLLNESPAFSEISKELFIAFNFGLHKYYKGKFYKIKDLSDYGIYASRIFGRSLNDLFYKTTYGIGHYNGKDAIEIYHNNTIFRIREAVILENDVYFLCFYYPESKEFILHGKKRQE